MKLVPEGKWILGRIVDIQQTKSGLALPTSEIKNITVFMLVDKVGEEVKRAKPGDVILYKAMNHVYLRDGTHYGVALDEGDNVICKVEDIDLDSTYFAIEGQKRVDGSLAQPGGPTPTPPTA